METPVQLAILFWFYKELEICVNRLVLLRRQNPDMPIYGLYGGPADRAGEAVERLGKYLDDFYVYDGREDSEWRWFNGDHLIAAWHAERGRSLPWDTMVVVQWDALLLRPVRELFHMLGPGAALLSGLRPAAEVADWWLWLHGPEKEQEAEAFRVWLRVRYRREVELWCCQFIVVCLPRQFLDLYVAAGPPQLGFIEYRVPTLARAFGTPCCEAHPFQPWWGEEPSTRDAPAHRRILNAMGKEATFETVLDEFFAQQIGFVHPYRAHFPWWKLPADCLEGPARSDSSSRPHGNPRTH